MKKIQVMSLSLGLATLGLASIANAATVADIGADYINAPGYLANTTAPTQAPTGWEYFSSSTATGTANALSPQTTIGNGGNAGFSVLGISTFNIGVLGGMTTGGAQYEIFDDGYDGNGGNRPTGNEGVVGVDLLMQPGDDAGTEYMIARYTFSAADLLNGTTASIMGSFRELTGRTGRQADSITASVYHNTTSLFEVVGGTTAGTDGYLTQADGTFTISSVVIAENDTISFVVFGNGSASSDETALQGTIAVIPEPGTYALLAGCLALGSVVIRRRK